MSPPKRWVVFGGTGHLGTALDALAEDAGLSLIRWGRKDVDLDDLLRAANRERRASSLEDLACHPVARAALIKKIREVEAEGVLNLAALTDVTACQKDPTRAVRLNAAAAGVIASAASGAFLPCVHVSTDYVFGGESGPYGPRYHVCPVNEYGKSKAAGERLVRLECAHVVRMSFLPDDPGYKWIFEGVRCTKEWVGSAAKRLRDFLLNLPEHGIYNLVRYTDNTLEDLVRQRFPDLPGVPVDEAEEKIGYKYPSDVRLKDAWRPPEEPPDAG